MLKSRCTFSHLIPFFIERSHSAPRLTRPDESRLEPDCSQEFVSTVPANAAVICAFLSVVHLDRGSRSFLQGLRPGHEGDLGTADYAGEGIVLHTGTSKGSFA